MMPNTLYNKVVGYCYFQYHYITYFTLKKTISNWEFFLWRYVPIRPDRPATGLVNAGKQRSSTNLEFNWNDEIKSLLPRLNMYINLGNWLLIVLENRFYFREMGKVASNFVPNDTRSGPRSFHYIRSVVYLIGSTFSA